MIYSNMRGLPDCRGVTAEIILDPNALAANTFYESIFFSALPVEPTVTL
jgi:hypothetical protein